MANHRDTAWKLLWIGVTQFINDREHVPGQTYRSVAYWNLIFIFPNKTHAIHVAATRRVKFSTNLSFERIVKSTLSTYFRRTPRRYFQYSRPTFVRLYRCHLNKFNINGYDSVRQQFNLQFRKIVGVTFPRANYPRFIDWVYCLGMISELHRAPFKTRTEDKIFCLITIRDPVTWRRQRFDISIDILFTIPFSFSVTEKLRFSSVEIIQRPSNRVSNCKRTHYRLFCWSETMWTPWTSSWGIDSQRNGKGQLRGVVNSVSETRIIPISLALMILPTTTSGAGLIMPATTG